MNCADYALKYLRINLYEYEPNHSRTIDIPRPFHTITQIKRGTVTFSDTYDNIITASEGEIVYVPMGTVYTMSWKGESPSNIAIHYQLALEGDNAPMQLIRGVKYPLCEVPQSELMQMSLFYRLYSLCEPQIKATSTQPIDSRIECALEYIRVNYNVDFTIEQLSDMCHLSPSRFHYLFKKSVGYTAIDYKNKLKTDIAMQLLITTSLSIEEISDRLNYNSAIYFRRVFKKFTGMSATQYRTSYYNQEMKNAKI